MAVLTETLWRGEPIKAIIKFGDNLNYEVYTDKIYSQDNSFIKDIRFNLSEGNSSVNPLGVNTSNSISMQIYDESDRLSPANVNSPYYGKIVNGVEIDLFINYTGSDWEPYGVYFTTSWSGGFSEGWHGMTSICAEDKLNTIGNMDMPELPAEADIEAAQLITNVMYALGFSNSDFTIDPSINQSFPFGTMQGKKVRDFLNNICQLLLARVIIDREGIIRFVSALNIYQTGNELWLMGEYTGTLGNKNTSNVNYNKVAVTYLERKDIKKGVLFSDNTHSLTVGNNVINDISLNGIAITLEDVKILHDTEDASIDNLNYTGYQNGISLSVDVSGADIEDCNIIGQGLMMSTNEKVLTIDINNSTIVGGLTFEFNTKHIMSQSDANSLAVSIRDYINIISRQITIDGSALTPKLYLGDKIIISGTDTLYDGTYKVIGLDINFSENYNVDVTLIRLNS